MRNTTLLFLFLLAACLDADVCAQNIRKKHRFKRIEVNAGLSNSNITVTLQDSKGFLWVGTDDGLNRYDGYEFRIYRNIPNDTASLLKNRVQSIFEDHTGTLWVSTLNSGLQYYDRARDRF